MIITFRAGRSLPMARVREDTNRKASLTASGVVMEFYSSGLTAWAVSFCTAGSDWASMPVEAIKQPANKRAVQMIFTCLRFIDRLILSRFLRIPADSPAPSGKFGAQLAPLCL